MNSRFVKLVAALALCVIGLYTLAASLFSQEAAVGLLGGHLPLTINIFLCVLGIVAGVLLARQAIIEELSVTSD